eukprot:Gb_08747 [translate_table: standard]
MASMKANTERGEEHLKMQNVKKGLQRLDRRSGSGMSGAPKKGGHGGKFTWSGTPSSDPHDLQPTTTVLDEKDPNYVDCDEESEQAEGAEKLAPYAEHVEAKVGLV